MVKLFCDATATRSKGLRCLGNTREVDMYDMTKVARRSQGGYQMARLRANERVIDSRQNRFILKVI